MPLIKLVLFESDANPQQREYPHLANLTHNDCELAINAIEAILQQKYYMGQDDGKYFFGVLPEDENVLKQVFPGIQITNADSDDYPWDQSP